MKVIALYNSKGGVGKTTSCVNLAWVAASQGGKVLLWDLDPQGAASFTLSVDKSLDQKAKKLISGKADWAEEIQDTPWQNLKLIPADLRLRDSEILMEEEKRSKKLLGDWIKKLRLNFDVIFLDCPPGLSLLTENILRAADVIIVPVVPTPLAVRSLGHMDEFLTESGKYSSKIHPFLSMADRRKKVHKNLATYLLNRSDSLKTVIPPLAEIERMGVTRKPSASVLSSRSSELYASLWREIEPLS